MPAVFAIARAARRRQRHAKATTHFNRFPREENRSARPARGRLGWHRHCRCREATRGIRVASRLDSRRCHQNLLCLRHPDRDQGHPLGGTAANWVAPTLSVSRSDKRARCCGAARATSISEKPLVPAAPRLDRGYPDTRWRRASSAANGYRTLFAKRRKTPAHAVRADNNVLDDRTVSRGIYPARLSSPKSAANE